jgi:hypothetical protein
MPTHSGHAVGQHTALYRAVLAQSAASGEVTLLKVLGAARQSLQDRAALTRSLSERDHFELTLQLLLSHGAGLCAQYPRALRIAFDQSVPGRNIVAGDSRLAILASVNFDQLELMDSDEVEESVTLARSLQSAMLAADAALAELNTFVSAALGLKTVQPDRNPLRPEIFVEALQGVLAQTNVSSMVRMEWLEHMSAPLGRELSLLYRALSQQLKNDGVVAAGYTVTRTHDNGSRRSGPEALRLDANPAYSRRAGLDQTQDNTLLTLDRLRRLLAGELDISSAPTAMQSFAAQFARNFENAETAPLVADFEATVPAAFEALQEMKQVGHMLERIGERHIPGTQGVIPKEAAMASPQAVREHMRRTVKGLGPSLSIEVVALMVENIARDERLLAPVKQIVKDLEPALLRLVVVDPRFFSDKQHPARRLLQEVTDRSLAFDAEDAKGFGSFLVPLRAVAIELLGLEINDAQPFELALQHLVQGWDEHKPAGKLAQAVQALQHAEARHLLAEKVAQEIAARPEAGKVTPGVLKFLCGPWAQVIANARMADASNAVDPHQYRELVVALLWSAQPELTRKNVAKLTRLVPLLLGKLREGLDRIGYPSLKTSEFFELLMNLHQQAFSSTTSDRETNKAPGLRASLTSDEDPWLDPSEVKASGFMELVQDAVQPEVAALAVPNLLSDILPEPIDGVQDVPLLNEATLHVGSWVELQVNDHWVRTQLSWASPHGTLFLFTSAFGTTQSMTRRSRDKLLATGAMRLLSGRPMVDGALDAVAQTALLNSLEIKP